MTSPTAIRPGFGKAPDIPKTLSNKKTSSGGKDVTATPSNLKSSATQTISTSTLSNEWRSKASTNSSNFVPGQRPIEFTRDRTVTVPHGVFADAGGKYQLESDMGMTKRSTERLLKSYNQSMQQQQLAYLNNLNARYGNNNMDKVSLMQSVLTLPNIINGLIEYVKNKNTNTNVKAPSTQTVTSSDSNIAAMQNATTASDLSTAIEAAKGKVSEIGTKLTTLKGELSNLKGQTSGLQTAKDEATQALADNKTSISQKQGEVQNNIQRESASQMAMNAAQTQVDMLKSQLSTAGPLAKAGIEASLAQAEQQLELKTKQYEEAVKAREQSENDLKALQDQTPTLENNEKTAKAKLEDNKNQIASKESDVTNYGMLEKDMNLEIGKQEERLATLQKKEESNKKA